MKKLNSIIIKIGLVFMMPFILLLALYVQMHGDYSPGGGFQSGAIAASIIIVYSMISGKFVPIAYAKLMSGIGVLIYGGVGCFTMLLGGNFLDYDVMLQNSISGQSLGVLLVEGGVGITVFAAMLLIYNSFVRK